MNRGAGDGRARRRARSGSLLAVAATLGAALTLAACGGGGGGKTSSTAASSATSTSGTTTTATASVADGRRLFAATCGSCHMLADAGSTATVGPDLDYVQPTVEQTEQTIASGMRGSRATMPAGLLRGQQAADVAAYLAQVAKRSNVRPPNP